MNNVAAVTNLSVAQQRLRATRAELKELLLDERIGPDPGIGVFPRSATMRLLMNGTGRRAAGAVISLLLLKLAPRLVRVMSVLPLSQLLRSLIRTAR